MKQLIIATFLCTGFLLGCSEDSKTPPAGPPAESPDEKAQRLKEMPLEQALRTKYSRIQFICDYYFKVTRPSGSGSTTYSQTVELPIWDILQDYNTDERWFDFDYNFENVKSNFQFKVQLQLEDLTAIRRDNEGRDVAVRLRNAVVARGEVQLQILELSLDGKNVEFRMSKGPVNIAFVDRIPNELTRSSFGPSTDPRRHTTVDVKCSLSAEVLPGYESDYQEIGQN